jgi:hypothetical protein
MWFAATARASGGYLEAARRLIFGSNTFAYRDYACEQVPQTGKPLSTRHGTLNPWCEEESWRAVTVIKCTLSVVTYQERA